MVPSLNNQRGSILLVAVVIMAIGAMISVTLLRSAAESSKSTGRFRETTTLFQIAEAGSEHALTELRYGDLTMSANTTAELISPTAYAGGVYRVDYRTNDDLSMAWLTSTASMSGRANAIEIALSVTPGEAIPGPGGDSDKCGVKWTNGGGFSTEITSVVENENNTYTITLTVTHNGCGGPSCKDLSHYSIEAAPGTYSAVVFSGVNGKTEMGPNLGSDPFKGFKRDNTSGIGGGKAGTFTVTYTLTGGLQSQRTSAKAGTSAQIATLTVGDFQSVLECRKAASGPAQTTRPTYEVTGWRKL